MAAQTRSRPRRASASRPAGRTVSKGSGRQRDDTAAAELSPEVKYYLTKWQELHDRPAYKIPRWCRPLFRTPEPRNVPGAIFDPERVDRVIAALRVLRHTKGKWAGRPLDPDPWQVAYVIAPIFGWVAPNADGKYVRIIRRAMLDVARKNGKTTIASGIALYMAFADGEWGAEVLAVAGSKDQAGNAYRPAKLIAENSPELKAGGVRALVSQIERPSDGSFFKAVASVGDLIHGSNVAAAIVDELHIHKNAEVLDAVESGTGAREQPLTLVITTPDDGSPNSVYGARRDYVEKLARGVIEDPSHYGVIFGARESDDPFVESTWRRANPGYGTAPTAEFMRQEARKAKNSPLDLARFQRLNLGIRTKQRSRYWTLSQWDASAGIVREDRLEGRTAYGGLDLAATTDLAALCWLFPVDDGEGFDVLWRVWTPEAQVAELDKRTANAASAWVRQGWLTTTPGDVIDYDAIKAQILDDLERFDVAGIGVDPWNATHLTNQLQGEGAPIVSVRQGFVTLSPALKTVRRLLVAGSPTRPLLQTGGNPVARWASDNLAVSEDAAGNVKPDKAKASDKIDPISALVTAMSLGMAHTPPERSAYESDGLNVV